MWLSSLKHEQQGFAVHVILFIYLSMASFDVNPWCEGNGLIKETVDILKAQDLDTEEALAVVLVANANVDKIHITLLLSKGYDETVRIVGNCT